MIRGLYTAAAGMRSLQDKQNILNNNLANVSTVGYKADQAISRSFPEVLMNSVQFGSGTKKSIGTMHQAVFIEESVPMFNQGTLIDSNVSTHMAIVDENLEINEETGQKPAIFFKVKDQNGNMFYTRSGLFFEDAAGQLVTPEGHLVMDDIDFPIDIDGREFSIDEKGTIIFTGGQLDWVQIQTTKVNDPNKMVKVGEQLYSIEDESIIDTEFKIGKEDYKILQGKLEGSNVDVNQTVIDMNTALSLYEANQQVVKTIDRTLDLAVNQVGRV
ncbi:MAG: flagellar hook-basal body protein [Vulcanibacillus sp.]